MHPLGIVMMCGFAAMAYGIAHDQITARVCIEYFTIGHPPLLNTEDPTLFALAWGIVATWWVGILLGIPFAIVARAGSRPKRSTGSLVRPISCLLAVMAGCAFAAGVTGWLLASSGIVFLVGPIAVEVPPDRHVAYLACLWAHSASYLTGLFGGVVLHVLVWRSRNLAATAETAVEQSGRMILKA